MADNSDNFRNEDNQIAHEGDNLDNIVVRDQRMKKFANAAKEVYGEMFGSTGYFIKDAAITFGRGMSMPFTIPAAIRRGKEHDPIWGNSPGDSNAGLYTGYTLTVVGWMGLILTGIMYPMVAAQKGEPAHGEYYLIPVATNLVDWLIYEPLRKAWIRSKED
jgi:hypothetical protein